MKTKKATRPASRSPRSVPHEIGLLEDLKDDTFAMAYLNGFLEERSDEAFEAFMVGLGQFARARGINSIAIKSKRTRDAIYKAFSPKGNPTLSTFRGILSAMDLQIQISQRKRA